MNDYIFSNNAINNPLKQQNENNEPAENQTPNDPVNHPNHYKSSSGLEVIDVIKTFTMDMEDGFEAFCTGNVLKYACRWFKKNGDEDLKKAKQYVDILLKYRNEKER